MTPLLKSLIVKRCSAYQVGSVLALQIESPFRDSEGRSHLVPTTIPNYSWIMEHRTKHAGSSSKDQWQHLLQETTGRPQLLNAPTMEIPINFNTDNVYLLPFSDQEWNIPFHILGIYFGVVHFFIETVYTHSSKLKSFIVEPRFLICRLQKRFHCALRGHMCV